MGSTPSTTTQTTNSSPWKPAQPALQDILQKGQALSNNTDLFTPTTSNSTQLLQNAVANSQNPTQSAQTIDPLLQQTNANYTTGANTLGQIASGGAANVNMNPYINNVLDVANQKTADNVNSQFSSAGRYGSGAQTSALTNSIANQNNTALTNQWNTQQTNAQNAATSLTGQGITAAGLAPQVDQANLNNQNTGIVAGQQLDANAQAVKQAPLAALSYEQGIAQPIAGTGGTSSSTGTQVQQSNPLTTALGLGLAGASLFSGGASSAASGIASAFSDERLKENIQEVGKTHDGQKIYSYNYKGDNKPTLGLLAQEVEKKVPEAVGEVGGLKTVNYRTATKGAARGGVKNPSRMGMLAG